MTKTYCGSARLLFFDNWIAIAKQRNSMPSDISNTEPGSGMRCAFFYSRRVVSSKHQHQQQQENRKTFHRHIDSHSRSVSFPLDALFGPISSCCDGQMIESAQQIAFGPRSAAFNLFICRNFVFSKLRMSF